MRNNNYTVHSSVYISLFDTLNDKSYHDGMHALSEACLNAVEKFCVGKCISSEVTTKFDLSEYGVDLYMTRPMTETERIEFDNAQLSNEEKQERRDWETYISLQQKYHW